MRRLTLVRHASAETQTRRSLDIERALDQRGMHQAQAMARRLRMLDLTPDLLLTSTAVRAVRTTETFARELELSPQRLRSDARLYLASPADILEIIMMTSPDVHHLMIVGHNPGLSELARQLAPPSQPCGLETAAFITFRFEIGAWLEIAPHAVCEARHETPPARLG